MKQLSDAEREDLKEKLAEYHAERVNVLRAKDQASSALFYSIIGLFFFGIILGPIAISKGAEALDIIEMDPQHEGRGKAIVGIIIGSIATILSVIGLLIFALYLA